MGRSSNAKRYSIAWLGAPVAHAFIVKEGIHSAMSLCGIPFREVLTDEKGPHDCAACGGIRRRGDHVTWLDPRPKKPKDRRER